VWVSRWHWRSSGNIHLWDQLSVCFGAETNNWPIASSAETSQLSACLTTWNITVQVTMKLFCNLLMIRKKGANEWFHITLYSSSKS
jgi:hypothetical protein